MSLTDLMTGGALLVDLLRVMLLWGCLLLLPFYLIALVVWLFGRLNGEDPEAAHEASCFQPAGLRERLDWMANGAASQRPRVRKHRHRHHTH